MALRHERVEGWGLAGLGQGWREKAGSSAGVEVEEVGADGDAEMLLVFGGEGSVGEMGEGEVGGGVVGVWEPALGGCDALFCHGA